MTAACSERYPETVGVAPVVGDLVAARRVGVETANICAPLGVLDGMLRLQLNCLGLLDFDGRVGRKWNSHDPRAAEGVLAGGC